MSEEPKKNESKKNGKAEPPPPEIKLDEMDLMRLELLQEKKKRLDAEQQRLNVELAQHGRDNDTFVGGLNQKYGVNFEEYVLFPTQRLAKRKELVPGANQPAPPPPQVPQA